MLIFLKFCMAPNPFMCFDVYTTLTIWTISMRNTHFSKTIIHTSRGSLKNPLYCIHANLVSIVNYYCSIFSHKFICVHVYKGYLNLFYYSWTLEWQFLQFAVTLFAPTMVWSYFALIVFSEKEKAQIEPF